jgi:hypothetical protein
LGLWRKKCHGFRILKIKIKKIKKNKKYFKNKNLKP